MLWYRSFQRHRSAAVAAVVWGREVQGLECRCTRAVEPVHCTGSRRGPRLSSREPSLPATTPSAERRAALQGFDSWLTPDRGSDAPRWQRIAAAGQGWVQAGAHRTMRSLPTLRRGARRKADAPGERQEIPQWLVAHRADRAAWLKPWFKPWLKACHLAPKRAYICGASCAAPNRRHRTSPCPTPIAAMSTRRPARRPPPGPAALSPPR